MLLKMQLFLLRVYINNSLLIVKNKDNERVQVIV